MPKSKRKHPLRLEWIEAGSLSPNPANWRRHPDGQLGALRGMLNDPEVGWAGALLFNERTGRLIDGHARQKVVTPKTPVPVLVGSWTEEAEKKILLTLDPLAGMAFADVAQLEALLGEVQIDAEWFRDLRQQLDVILNESRKSPEPDVNEGLADPDEVPEPPDEPVTKPGDLWVLGTHRLLCGDSGSAADVDRLLHGESVHLVNTDPPYNVKVEPRSNNAIAAGLSSYPAAEKKGAKALDAQGLHHSGFDVARRRSGIKHHQKLDVSRHPGKTRATHRKMRAKDRPLANDFVSDEAFEKLLHAWFGNIARVLLPGRCFYIWGGYANVANYPPVLKACGLYFSQAVIWVKEHPVLTRKDFLGNHEWAFYGWREGAAHEFFGPPNISDVWSVKKVTPQAMVHLTEKPTELAGRAIRYSSRPGENVLDLFGGSGSTLIAAEQTQRRAFLMEMDPLYCDVIVRRWEKFAGQTADHVGG